LLDEHADLLFPIGDPHIAERGGAYDLEAVLEALHELIAIRRVLELGMHVRREGGDGGRRKFHEVVDAHERLADQVPVGRVAGVAHRELHAIRGPYEGAVVAEELRGQLIAIEIVGLLQAHLVDPQPQSLRRIAQPGRELLQIGLTKAERSDERNINGETKELDGQNVHGPETLRAAGPRWQVPGTKSVERGTEGD
jgi:hypothetical protein